MHDVNNHLQKVYKCNIAREEDLSMKFFSFILIEVIIWWSMKLS